MTREEAYIKLNRIEMLADDLRVCFEHGCQPDFMPDDEKLGEYAEEILAYIRTCSDEKVMIDCCKINRSIFYRFMDTRHNPMGLALLAIRRCLWKIHNYALSTIWGVSREDIENCTYYVNSVEGVCRNSNTGELLPLPTDNTHEGAASPAKAPTMGLPSKFDVPEVLKIFVKAQKLGLMNEQYKWQKGLQLLACFAREMSLKFKWGKGVNTNGEPRISWQPFEQFYGLKKYTLRSNYNDIQKTGQQPTDTALIDQLFK